MSTDKQTDKLITLTLVHVYGVIISAMDGWINRHDRAIQSKFYITTPIEYCT